MFEDRVHQEQRVVAVASSEASAELVATALAVHGIRAAVTAVDRVHPSVNWAQGVRVAVAAEDEEAARGLLQDLTGDDVVEVEDGSGSG